MNWIYGLLLIMIVCVLIAGGVIWSINQPRNLAAKEQVVAGQATVGGQQAQSNAAAQTIVVKGDQRAHLDIQVHQQNAEAIQAAPGASQELDPRFVAAFNRGLCEYPSDAADPGCAGLHPGNSTVVPDTSP